MQIMLVIIVFFFGLAIGSFLNVCIYRLPREKSIILPRSFCPRCRESIAWYDNIPLLSFIVLKGKCRLCHAPISFRYPLVELLVGLLFVAVHFYVIDRRLSLLVIPFYWYFVASLIALTQDELKRLLAFSTIGQLSYIVLGAALLSPKGLMGSMIHIAMHAFGKITLFFCAGAIYVAAHKTEISDMHGIGRRMPITTAAFCVGALSVIGLPPFGGSWSKWWLALGAVEGEQALLVAVLMISSLLNVAYLMPVVVRGFFFAPEDGTTGLQEAPPFCLIPLCVTAVGCVVLFFFADRVYRLLEPLVGG